MFRLLIAAFLAIAVACPALAGDLGQVQVPMPDGSQGDSSARQAALQQGLEQVIARLTGKSVDQVSQLPGAAQALTQPDKWLLRYGYESGDPPVLQARFDADALAGYLAQQGVAVWSGPRPPVLVWLVDGGSGRGHMVSVNDPLAPAITQAAAQQGLTVILPAWDQQDQSALTVTDIRGRFDSPLLQASKRYGADWIATGVIYGGSGNGGSGNGGSGNGGAKATVNWRLLHDGSDVADQRLSAASGEAAAQAMIAGVGDALVARFRVVGGGGVDRANPVIVHGVDTLQKWVDLKKNLLALGTISAVDLRQADGDTLRLAVNFAGSRDELAQTLTRLPALQVCDQSAAAPPAETSAAGTDTTDRNPAAPAASSATASAAPATAAKPAPAALVFCER